MTLPVLPSPSIGAVNLHVGVGLGVDIRLNAGGRGYVYADQPTGVYDHIEYDWSYVVLSPGVELVLYPATGKCAFTVASPPRTHNTLSSSDVRLVCTVTAYGFGGIAAAGQTATRTGTLDIPIREEAAATLTLTPPQITVAGNIGRIPIAIDGPYDNVVCEARPIGGPGRHYIYNINTDEPTEITFEVGGGLGPPAEGEPADANDQPFMMQVNAYVAGDDTASAKDTEAVSTAVITGVVRGADAGGPSAFPVVNQSNLVIAQPTRPLTYQPGVTGRMVVEVRDSTDLEYDEVTYTWEKSDAGSQYIELLPMDNVCDFNIAEGAPASAFNITCLADFSGTGFNVRDVTDHTAPAIIKLQEPFRIHSGTYSPQVPVPHSLMFTISSAGVPRLIWEKPPVDEIPRFGYPSRYELFLRNLSFAESHSTVQSHTASGDTSSQSSTTTRGFTFDALTDAGTYEVDILAVYTVDGEELLTGLIRSNTHVYGGAPAPEALSARRVLLSMDTASGIPEVSWMQPDRGAELVTGYQIKLLRNGSDLQVANVSSTARSHTFSAQLIAGVYSAEVRPISSSVRGITTESNRVSFAPLDPISAPRSVVLTITETPFHRTGVTWQEPSTGADLVVFYGVELLRDGTVVQRFTVSSTTRNYRFDNVSAAGTYTARVSAIDSNSRVRGTTTSNAVQYSPP